MSVSNLAKLAIRTVALLLAVSLPGQPALASAQASRPADAPTGSIAGTVKRDGKPAAGVGLIVVPNERSGDGEQPLATTTSGEDGTFRFGGIPAGTHVVLVDAPGYVVKQATSWRGDGVTVSVGPGESIEGFDVDLTLGGVITGRVTIEGGRPAVEQQVKLWRVESDGTPRLVGMRFLNSSSTDDRGVYRIFGLAAGRYLVGAGESDDPYDMTLSRANRYRLTYHPAAADRKLAETVTVSAGGEATGIDITLPKAERLHQVSGTFVYADTGAPAPGVTVFHGAIDADGGTGSWGSIGKSNHSGEWRVTGLKPGKFAIFGRVEKGSPYYSESVDVEISDTDLDAVVVELKRGISVEGTVVVESVTANSPRPEALTVSLDHVDAPNARASRAWPPQASVAADGSFVLTGAQEGKYRFVIGPWNIEPRPVLVSIETEGNVFDGALTLRQGETPPHVRIRIAFGTSSIRGTAKVTGAPSEATHVVFLRRVSSGAHVARARVDARGQFFFQNLAAGEYALVLMAFIRDGSSYRQYNSAEQKITVGEGGTTNANLELEVGEATEVRRDR